VGRFTQWRARRRGVPQSGSLTVTTVDQLLVMSAEAGNTSAMCKLGDQFMRQGKAAEAKRWFRKAADAGSTDGMNNLGCVLAGEGKATEAVSWLTKAAERGHQEAIDNLAHLRA
jgi:TPR repeat protein